MEAIAFLAVVLAVGFLASRHGRDSRDGVGSKEEELARHGVTWEGQASAITPDQATEHAAAPSRASNTRETMAARCRTSRSGGRGPSRRGRKSCGSSLPA